MSIRLVVGVICVSGLVSSVALAQPGADDRNGAPMEAPPPPPPMQPAPMQPAPMQPPAMQPAQPAPAENPNIDKGIVEDANAGRTWLMPTALTEPAGTWSFSDYELFFASLAYSVTDQLSISATTLLPIVEDIPFWLLLNAKYQVLRSGRVRVAAQGAVTYVHDSSGSTSESASGAVLGGALTVCLDDECHSNLNGYVGAGFAHEDQSAVPMVFAGSLTLRANKHVKLMLEGDSAYIAGDINEAANGILAWYGVRFTSSIIGVDLGFAKPLCEGCSDTGLVMGFPFVSFTYRAIKD